MNRLAILACTLAAGLLAAPAQAAPTIELLRKRAEAQRFDGAILIGEADGTSQTTVVGTDPVAPDAVWRWASITKQVAAVLVMQEVEAGNINLDAAVSLYLPDWRSPGAARVRIRDLLLHRSGLPQPDTSLADAQGVPSFYRETASTPEEAAKGFCAGPLRAEPQSEFEYNNCDAIILGEVLHAVTGKPFAELVRERVAKPLGLESMGFYSLANDRANHVLPNGDYASIDGLLNMGVYGASGGAFGVIGDLWRFDHALLSGRLVGEAQRAQMWVGERSNGFHGFFQWIYPANLKGCKGPTKIVERQGLIAGIELRNYLLPETGRSLILFSRHRPTGIGDPWEGKGLAFDLLSMANCR